jgi:three-Cys-motif partner protein
MAKSLVGPWAKDKLDRLGKYLNAYTKIMRKQTKFDGYYYIDAFAGPGEHEIRDKRAPNLRNLLLNVADFGQSAQEQQRFLAGSPRVALDIDYPFSAYVFVERSPSRVAQLEALKVEYGTSRKIAIRQRDCNGYLRDNVVANPRIDWRRNRALVFLDPFGMQVPWVTLQALGRTRAIEVLLNFPVGMAIQRLLPRDPDRITDKRRAMLDEYFGSPEWFDVIYPTIKTLYGEDTPKKLEKSGKPLLEWYQNRLKHAFGFVSKAALFRNTRGGHLYYLLLASHNQTGVKIANHILGAGEAV